MPDLVEQIKSHSGFPNAWAAYMNKEAERERRREVSRGAEIRPRKGALMPPLTRRADSPSNLEHSFAQGDRRWRNDSRWPKSTRFLHFIIPENPTAKLPPFWGRTVRRLARIIQEFGEFLPLLEYLSCCKESNLSTPERGEDDYTA